MEQKKKIKTAITVLAVLLALSLVALAGTLIYNKVASRPASTVTVPDNLITPDEGESNAAGEKNPGAENLGTENSGVENPGENTGGSTATRPTAEPRKAAAIELYSKQPQDNTAFQAGNMFPGDAETKYYCIRVSYHDQITVHYRATVRPGYEKLAEVLKVRVLMPASGEILYDGLMRDMPESVTHKLASSGSTTDELYYQITAYLDTSVGNEYQNKDLIADFSWWVEETGNLDDLPKTGDTSHTLLWVLTAAASGCVLLLLLFIRRRKEDDKNG